MIERFFIGLYASSPAALLVAVLVQLFPPSQWTAPALRPAWPMWGLIALWLAASVLLAAVPRAVTLWRAALTACAVSLLAATFAGWWLGAPLQAGMAASLVAVAIGCATLVAGIGEHRVKHHRAKPGQTANGAAHATASAASAASAALRWRARLLRGLPFWVSAGLLLEAFRLAHVVASEPQRGSGMVGMLVAFFLLLPAASLSAWLPRTAAVLMLLAALAYGGLALKAGLPVWWLGALLSTALAAQAWVSRSAAQPSAGRQLEGQRHDGLARRPGQPGHPGGPQRLGARRADPRWGKRRRTLADSPSAPCRTGLVAGADRAERRRRHRARLGRWPDRRGLRMAVAGHRFRVGVERLAAGHGLLEQPHRLDRTRCGSAAGRP